VASLVASPAGEKGVTLAGQPLHLIDQAADEVHHCIIWDRGQLQLVHGTRGSNLRLRGPFATNAACVYPVDHFLKPFHAYLPLSSTPLPLSAVQMVAIHHH
jgi:hypothetical protein